MGIWVSKLMNLFGEREARILVLGLDNAGKTTILCASRGPRSAAAPVRPAGRPTPRGGQPRAVRPPPPPPNPGTRGAAG